MTFFVALLAVLIAGCTSQGERAPKGSSPAVSSPSDSTSAEAAVAWLESYYRDIDAHHYTSAYAHWEEGGRASGKTYQEFSNGFGETDRVEATVGQPGPIGAAAGSRYIEIPIRIVARDDAGRQQVFTGTYTLRLSVVDGATPEQRSWHIYSAAIHREAT